MKKVSIFKNKGFIVSISVVVLLSVAAVIFAKVYSDGQMQEFSKSGYVIVANEQAESKVHSFDNGTKYAKKLFGGVTFQDNEKETVEIDDYNFVYFDDDTYTALSKGVLLNVQDISKNQFINHYALPAYMEVSATGNGYEIESNDDTVHFQEILWKISDSQYILLAENMKVVFSDDDIREVKGFIQIHFIDEGVIQLITQENVWQTVSSSVKIQTKEGAIVDLAKQLVEYNEAQMLMSKLVVDDDANIELSPLETKSQVVPEFDIKSQDGESGDAGTDGANGKRGGSGSQGQSGNDGEDSEDAQDGADGQDGENGEDVTDRSTFKTQIPTITLTDWKVTATSIVGQYHVEDPNEMMDDQLSLDIKIYESGNGEAMNCVDEATGLNANGFVPYQDMKFKNETILKPDTEYRLVIRGTYEMNGTVEKEFLSRVFYTDSLGVMIEKSSYTTNEINILLSKKDYSTANLATVYLLTEEQAKEEFNPNNHQYISQTIDLSQEKTLEEVVQFNQMKSNQKFLVRLVVEIDGQDYLSQQVINATTLKQTPTLTGTPTGIANRQEWAFELYGGSVTDPDKAIVSYKYEVYGADQNNDSSNYNKLIRQFDVTPSETNKATMLYLKESIKSGIQYNFQVTALYNDNEKIVELKSDFSPAFSMLGTQLPAVSYQPHDTKHESIDGYLVLNLNGSKIDVSATHPLTVHIACEGIYDKAISITSIGDNEASSAWKDGDNIYINIHQMGLKEGQIYRFSVSGYFDVHDTTGFQERTIGHVVNATKDIMSFTANWSSPKNTDTLIGTHLSLTSVNTPDSKELNTLTRIDLQLVSATDPDRIVGSTQIMDDNDDPYESSLVEQFYQKGVDITEETFHLQAKDLSESAYIIKIAGIYDYTIDKDYTFETGGHTAKLTDYANKFSVLDDTHDVSTTSRPPALPDVDKLDQQIRANEITNAKSSLYGMVKDNDLNDDTIVGYDLSFEYANGSRLARKLHVYAFEESTYNNASNKSELVYQGGSLRTSGDWIEKIDMNIDSQSYTIPSLAILFGNGTNIVDSKTQNTYYTKQLNRGHIYRFVYVVEYDDESGTHVYPYQHPDFNSLATEFQNNYLLMSPTKETPRNKPNVVAYPYSQDSTTKMEIKYYYTDPDQAMTAGVSKINMGSQSLGVIGDKETWTALTVNNLSKNTLSLDFEWNPYDGNPMTQNANVSLVLDNQKRVTENDLKTISANYTLRSSDNCLDLKLTGINDEDIKNKITMVQMTFSAGGETVTLNRTLYYNDLNITIPYSVLSQLINKGEITVKTEVYYDTGNEGWKYIEDDNYFALQDASLQRHYSYLIHNSTTQTFVESEHAMGSSFILNKPFALDSLSNKNPIEFEFKSYSSNVTATKKVIATSNGLQLTDINDTTSKNIVVPKETKSFALTDIQIGEITHIVPSASAAGYDAYTNYVELQRFRISGVDNIAPEADGKKKFTLCLKKPTGEIIEIKYEISTEDSNKTEVVFDTLVISGLTKGTKYTVSAKANVKVSDTETSMSDLLNYYSSDGRRWTMDIETNSDVKIKDAKVSLDHFYYIYKKLNLSYTLGQTRGFKIQYTLCEKNNDKYDIVYDFKALQENGFLDESKIDEDVYAKNMEDTLRLYAGKHNKLQPEQTYYICIQLYEVDSSGNVTTELVADPVYVPFKIPMSQDPYVFNSMWADVDDTENKMNLNIDLSANDVYRVIMTQTGDTGNLEPYYYAKLFEIDADGNQKDVSDQIDEGSLKDKKLSLNQSYRFTFKNVQTGSQYQLKLYAMIDKDHDGKFDFDESISFADFDDLYHSNDNEKFVFYQSDLFTAPSSSGVSFGNQSISTNTNDPTKVSIRYDGAVKLENVDRVEYSMVHAQGTVISGNIQKTEGSTDSLFEDKSGGYYILNIPDPLDKVGAYNITVYYYQYDTSMQSYERIGSYTGKYVY